MVSSPVTSLEEFIQRLPKTETHLHIEGALPYELLQKLDPARFAATPEFWRDDYRYESFAAFEEILIGHALQWFTSAERYHEAAGVVFRKLQEQNCRYVETSFHLGIVEFTGIPGKEIVQAIKSAAPEGMAVRVFAGMLRDHWTPAMQPVIEELHAWEELDGVDLHGREDIPLEFWTAPIWERCRAAGKVTKAHAGEFGGAAGVRRVIEDLGVLRVEHGVRAIEDPAVVELARERGVTFDVCPISNIKLQVVPSLADHPIRKLMRAGVRCTVSTDDPFAFGNSLTDEYEALMEELQFTPAELAEVVSNGFTVASLPEEEKVRNRREIDDLLRNVESQSL